MAKSVSPWRVRQLPPEVRCWTLTDLTVSDEPVSVAGFIAAQRTEHGVPHATVCRALDVSQAWFYKWRGRPPTARAAPRARLAEAVRAEFAACGRTYGSPRITAELRAKGWRVGKNTVAAVMAELGLAGRPKRVAGR